MQTEESEREPDRHPVARIYTPEEVRDCLDALDDSNMAKLLKIGRGLASKADMEPTDLFQEAVCRMLTTRTCSIDVPFIAFAAGVMRSIASDAYQARIKRNAVGKGTALYAANDEAEAVSNEPTPEEAAVVADHYRRCLTSLDALIADDKDLQFLVEGIAEGLLGKDLEDFVATDTKGLAAMRKRLTRLRSRILPKNGTQKLAGDAS